MASHIFSRSSGVCWQSLLQRSKPELVLPHPWRRLPKLGGRDVAALSSVGGAARRAEMVYQRDSR
jgi:hypothetical protein